MTACVNRKHTKKVAAVVTASLVGALSLGVAPVAAMAEGIDALAEAIGTTEDWQGVTLNWSVDKDEYGKYTVQAGEDFTLESATYADGTTPVSMADVTVYYTKANVSSLDAGDKVMLDTPGTAGDYKAWVFNGKLETPDNWNGQLTAGMEADLDKLPVQTVEFRVAPKSLAGAYAYQGDDVNDTAFQYTGYSFNDGDATEGEPVNDIHFADAAGNPLAKDDYTLVKIMRASDRFDCTAAGSLVNAGKYIATLKGEGDYSGSTVEVEFTIRQIDLANDTFTVDVHTPSDNGYSNGNYHQGYGKVYVNGEELASNVVEARVVNGTMIVNGVSTPMSDPTHFKGDWPATMTLRVKKYTNGDEGSFVDANAYGEADGLVVSNLVSDFYYDGETIHEGDTFRFETAKGEAFNAAAITAVYDDENVAHDVKIYKDGEEVSDCSAPGTYTVQVSVKTDPATLELAGTRTFKVVVVSKRFSEQPKVFASVDGKDVKNSVEYDAKAVVPKVVAKAGSAVLTEGEDYTVTYKDAEGNAVEEIVEPGTYTATVDFGNAYYWKNGKAEEVANVEFEIKVTKATVATAKADQDVYPYVEDQVVAPTFTAYTKINFKGLSVAIDPSTDGATYYEVVCDKDGKPSYSYVGNDATWIDTDGDGIGNYWVYNDPMTGSELTETGWYVAELTVPNDDAHFTGSVVTAPFQISTYSVYADVAADAWYAQDVFAAREQGYMTGIAGTNLFMPEADITRGEIAQVFYNMSGADWSEDYGNDGYVPTRFDDVEGWAWYAEPIAWASNAGVVTGYDDSTFGPSDHATREQVATMLYRYAKTQGKDVTVEDADAALAAYKDGNQVSDWAKEAMAWAIENGIFGVDTDELWANQNIQRAAVASIAVRFQPEALPEA